MAQRNTQGRKATFIQASRSVSPSEKAAFHQISGAGKSHVLRQFFGLSSLDEAAILKLIDERIDQAIAKG